MLTSTDSVDLNGQPFKLYPERWTALAHFFILQMTNSLMWVTFAPISDITADFFGPDGFVGSLTAVNMLAVLFLILYPVGSVLASYSKSNYGLRVSLLIAAFFTVVGAFFRFIGVYVRNSVGGTSAYVMVFIGTAIVAIVQPIYINFPPTVSAIWFPVAERDIATAIGSMSNPVGNAIGTLIPVFIVYRNSSDDDKGSSIQGMSTLMLVEFLAVLVPLIVAWFSLMDSPPTPPSHSASLKITELSVHSSSALHSAVVAQTVASMGPSPMSSSLQSHSMAFSSSTLSGGSSLPTSSPANNVRLSDADFEHDLDDDPASFAANPKSSLGSHSTPAVAANPPPVRGRLSSFFDASRFSIFANADQGPKRSHKGSVLHDIHSLFQNRNFVVLVVTMSLLLGMFSAYLTVTYQLISHYDYTNRQAGVLGFVIIIAGLVGTVVVGYVMRRTRAYRSLLVGIVLSAVVFFIITLLVMVPNQFIALVFCTLLLGVTMLPILPVMMENCAEIAYPISEEVATGVVFSVSNIVGLVFIFIVQALIPRSHFHQVSPFAEVKVFMGAVMIAAGVVVFFYKGEYRRLERDLSKKEREARNGLLGGGTADVDNEDGSRSRAGSLGERLFNKLRRTSRKQADGSEPSENDGLRSAAAPPTTPANAQEETLSPIGHQSVV